MPSSINDASVGWRSATRLRIAPLLLATAVLVACNSRNDTEPAKKTPLPTRQTTIDPVTKKVDTAREDAERRRQQADDAYK